MRRIKKDTAAQVIPAAEFQALREDFAKLREHYDRPYPLRAAAIARGETLEDALVESIARRIAHPTPIPKPGKRARGRAVPEGYREGEYPKWVNRLPCIVCDPSVIENPWAHLQPVTSSEAHHLLTEGHALGRREPDAFCVPLCPTHHRFFDHKTPGRAIWFDADDDINLWYGAAKLRWWYQQGAPAEVGI